MARFYFDVDQGSAHWYKLRAGIPTASSFDKIITPSKMEMSAQRKAYACRIIAGRLMNWQAESLDKIGHIQAGKENEPLAVQQFEFVTETETKKVGFVTSDDGRFGASPDRVAGIHESSVDLVAEVKCPTVPVQFERLLFEEEKVSLIYRCQVQGQLWVAQADKAAFYSYHPRMPQYLVRTGRDDAFIAKLSAAMEQFSDELEGWMEVAQSLGVYQAFEDVLTPLDAERGPNSEQDLADIIEGELGNKLAWGG
jgi:hypothetical protein